MEEKKKNEEKYLDSIKQVKYNLDFSWSFKLKQICFYKQL